MKNLKLKKILKKLKRVVVAYSGGLDSTFLLKSAIDTLGRDNVLAVTAVSRTYPLSEFRQARRLARYIGARHMVIHTDELSDRRFSSNPVNRCYFCKKELFGKLDAIKKEKGMRYVLDGTNRDDLKDIRHGRKAARELGVISPLVDAGITKSDIRSLSRRLRLPTWDKPSFACLASRIPFNDKITIAKLSKIDKAESYLKKMGFKQVRVRLHEPVARIELYGEDMDKAVRLHAKIVKSMQKLGFVYITLDLAGYRTGSMHEE